MLDAINRLRDNIRRAFFGHDDAVDRVITCLLARGHVLIEDVPGVGKTVLATALARSLDCSFSRLQLTPDMLPSDVLGVSVYDRESGRFELKRGPIFANVVLADEINRTTPRTQSAMLEAMNEASVSVDGRVIPLEQPFMVIATQNPAEFEGAYPLPESQLDRFLMRIHLGYPSPEEEARILEQRPGSLPHAEASTTPVGASAGAHAGLRHLAPVLTRDEVLMLQARVDACRLDRSLIDYIIAIATATRNHPELQIGLSPRGALALGQAARATAVVAGRDYCIPEDVYSNVQGVVAHRLVARGHVYNGRTGAARRVLENVVQSIESPA